MILDLDVQYASEAPGLPDEAAFRRWAEAALSGRGGHAALVIRLVDEDEGRALNRDYRGKDYATNVLSFPFEPPPGLELPILGDLAICVPVVLREAAGQGKAPDAHWAHLTVHGILHLLGYDHQEDAEAEEMEVLERRVLAALGFPDPYGQNPL
ncbi:MAG: rRNA maturation RNase YbeY [Ectothiorhodospiraceae bacterium]|nr:rRNA maturation RNase YbeY [Ectothiorhodospiraceae bacterium]